MKVAVFGMGYVGTVTAACLADSGHEVWGVDVDAGKVAAISCGESPVVEPGIDDIIARTVACGALHATTDGAEAMDRCDISLVCVGTPSSPNGSTDLSFVSRAVDEIARLLTRGAPSSREFHSVVIRSTMPPGSVDSVVVPRLAAQVAVGRAGQVGVAFCPEFLREGTGLADFADPPFTVVGTDDDRVVAALQRLFWFLREPVRVTGVRTAEALKYACNAFHATKVSFANEVARVMRSLDVDAREVMELFCEDRHLNISPRYLRPGFAFGGSCLPKDLRSLLHLGRMNDVDLPLLTGVLASNELAVREVVDRVIATEARRVALLGLSFKSETDDLRESPNVALAETFVGKGLDVRIYDPIVNPARLVGSNRDYVAAKLPHLRRLLVVSPEDALDDAEVAVVSSAEPCVVRGLVAIRPPVILDLDGGLGGRVEAMPGYTGVGWSR